MIDLNLRACQKPSVCGLQQDITDSEVYGKYTPSNFYLLLLAVCVIVLLDRKSVV